MAKFTGTFDETFTIQASAETARAQFLDLDQVVAHYGDLDSGEKLDEHTLKFLLTNQNHGVFSFQGRYTCRYLAEGEQGVAWQSVGEPGNIETHGSATFRAVTDTTCEMVYKATLILDIEVNPILAPVLKPVVGASIPHEMRAYVKRMIKGAEAR